MKHLINLITILCLVYICSLSTSAQNNINTKRDPLYGTLTPYKDIDTLTTFDTDTVIVQDEPLPPQFSYYCNLMDYKGGDERLFKMLSSYLKYPEQAKKDSVSGTVYVTFIVDTNGHSTDIRIAKGVREDLDNEAMRAVDLMDEWLVGKQNGKKVKSEFTLPIKFTLKE